jgi:hypothetical protein
MRTFSIFSMILDDWMMSPLSAIRMLNSLCDSLRQYLIDGSNANPLF